MENLPADLATNDDLTVYGTTWSSSLDNVTQWEYYGHNTLSIAILSSFLGLMTIIGAVGNVLVILSVVLNRKLRTVTNCFIVSLAVADLLVSVFVMPISAIVEVTGQWWFGTLICFAFISADVFLCTSSIWNLLIISLERFMAISWPLWYGARRTKRVAGYLIAIAWTVSVVICLPPLFLQGIFEGAASSGQCTYALNEGYRIYSAFGSFWLPLAIILFCYARIFSVAGRKSNILTRHKSNIHGRTIRPTQNGNCPPIYPSNPSTSSSNELHDVIPAGSRQVFFRGASITETNLSSSTALIEIRFGDISPTYNSIVSNGSVKTKMRTFSARAKADDRPRPLETQSKGLQRRITFNGHGQVSTALTKMPSFKDRERKVFKVLLIILCSFVACWMGFFIIYTLEPFCSACKDLDKRVYAFFLWLGYFNSMLNPLIYAGFSKEFRTAFLDILACRCFKKRAKKRFSG